MFATYNYADNYSLVILKLLYDYDGDIDLMSDAPSMPPLREMQRLVAQSPRAQQKFFMLMDDVVDKHLVGIEDSYVG